MCRMDAKLSRSFSESRVEANVTKRVDNSMSVSRYKNYHALLSTAEGPSPWYINFFAAGWPRCPSPGNLLQRTAPIFF